jgi:Tol biopolymer transport system component
LRFASSQDGWMPGSVLAVALALALIAAGPAAATMPGPNGKIAFTSDRGGTKDVWVMQPDGSAETLIQSDAAEDSYAPTPQWSPDGREIAFMHEHRPYNHQGNIFLMEADGGNLRQITDIYSYDSNPTWAPEGDRIAYLRGLVWLTHLPPREDDPVAITHPGPYEGDGAPDWSPKGDLIAFTRADLSGGTWGPVYAKIYVVDPGGGDPRAITTADDVYDVDPSISPDGQTLVFARYEGTRADLYTIPIAGGVPTRLTDTANFIEQDPEWSPDGTKIAFAGRRWDAVDDFDVYTMNADGTGRTVLTESTGNDTRPSWQRVVPRVGYPRPNSANLVRLPLVPAFDKCLATNTNRVHGPPLGFDSCSPPDQASSFATVGTPDANGHPAASVGSVTLRVLRGNPATPADEADVRIQVAISDVRSREVPAASYPYSLWTSVPIQLTDIASGCCNFPATLRDDFVMNIETPCDPGPGPPAGSTCAVNTTADAFVPGLVQEGARATWQLTRAVDVYDGGPEGGMSDATLFATQGIFVP